MPLTAIEAAMFSNAGTHAVTAFAIGPSAITLSIAPWADEAAQARGHATDQTARTRACFQAVRLLSREVLTDDVPKDQEPSVPWDIIGFDSYALDQDRWRFVLQCAEIGYVWESAWPQLDLSNSAGSADEENGVHPSAS